MVDENNSLPQELPERLILFDGVCNFCHASVRFVIQRDAMQKFMFASLQSDFGEELAKKNQLEGLSTMVFVHNATVYTKSSAALRIARELSWPWPLLYGFLVVPAKVRDVVYDFIGNRRYQWFGKLDSCWIPTEDVADRFLDQEKTGVNSDTK